MNEENQLKHQKLPFLSSLKHPAQSATLPPKPSELNQAQSEIYQNVLNHLSTPNYQLPITLNQLRQKDTQSLLPLSDIERCYCSREFILRTCRATRWNQTACINRIEETLVWRREYGVDELDIDMISKESKTGKQFVLGYDVHSRPCLHMYPYRQNTKPSEDQIKFVVWCLERTIDLMPPGVEALTLLIDFGSSKVPNASGQPTTLAQAKQVLNILQTYYCERLGRAVLINVPWLFWGFYKLVKPFMDSRTADKIKFNPDVTELVPVEQLEKSCFGGQLEFEYDHETYFPLLIELAAQRRKQMLARYHRLGPNSIGLSEYELRGGKTETSVEDDDTSTSSPEIETAEPILRRPRFRHHAETDAADSVHSDRPPSGSQKSGIEGTEPTSNDYELPSIQESSTAPEPTSSTSPTSPNLKPATKSVSHAQPSTEPIIEAPIPTNRPDSQAIELKSNEESETPSKANSSKFSQKIGFMKNSLAFHFKQHQEEEKEKKRTKKENKAIANGLQVKADELGRPLTDQVGASRRLSRILAK